MWIGFPGSSVVKNLPNNVGEAGSIPGLRRSPGGRNGNLLQYPHLEIHGQKSLAGYSPFYSVTKSYLTLCDPMDCCTPGFPVLHRLPEFAQTHVHWVSDAIQPSYPLLPPSPPAQIFPSIRFFSRESALPIRWPKYWSFNFSISPFNEYSGLILQSKGLSRVFSNTTVQKHQFFSVQSSLWSYSHIHTWLLEKP